MRLRPDVQSGPSIFIWDFLESQTEKKCQISNAKKTSPRTGGNSWVLNRRRLARHFRPLARIVFCSRVSFITSDRAHCSLIPARTTPTSQNGRHVRCRPRPQQGPRGLHRQGRQHQLHDGVAAPRQQVSTGLEPRPRFRVFFPILREDRGARSLSMRRDLARSLPRKRSNYTALGGRARARAARSSRSTHASSAGPAGG